MNNYLESLKWRYATKKFDSQKQISEEDLKTLLEAIRLSPSSYGLQPYHIFIIKDIELREKLKAASWGQSQITDASHLIVFANNTSFDADLIDNYLIGYVGDGKLIQKEFQKNMKTELRETASSSLEKRAGEILKQIEGITN